MNKEIKQIRIVFISFIAGMTILSCVSLFWNINKEYRMINEYAKIEGEASFNKDLLYRSWAAGHGGVYVPITELTTPNPYLNFIKDRDIVIKGTEKELTLVNPAYMTRQVFTLAKEQYGVKGHITSLNPIRPENKADVWETFALNLFEKGKTDEYSSIETINGIEYLRFMHVMKVEKKCLKCHSKQGYKLGDIRGGISVSVPMEKYNQAAKLKISNLVIGHFSLYIIIFILSFFGFRLYKKELLKRYLIQERIIISEKKLQKQNEEYETINKNLIQAKGKAEESDRLKSAFLANMSHEIRTPMNGILGFTDLLKEPELSSDERDKFIEIIGKSGNRMLNTVNDIINISKIDADQVEISKTDLNINEEIENQFEFFDKEATAKGIELRLINKLPQQSIIISDKVKINSIISNLIKNAIKFTDKGSIEILCNKKGSKLEFNITDTGMGIPENRIHSIFNRFEQADIEDTRALEGSGLGLAISEAYVEMLGGNIGVDSEPGKGSTFYFTLPWIEKQEKPEHIKEKEVLNTASNNQINILIAEDDDISFEHLEIVLNNIAKSIARAVNGKEAIEYMKNNKDIDLVLMDAKMPVMDGYTATTEIRKFNKDVIIIAQTAYAIEGDKEKAIAAGCDDYISKPIIADNLIRKIIEYIKKQ